MRIVGLTGNIAAGKSTVAAALAAGGLPVIDCDALAHAAAQPGRWAYRRLVRAFGRAITVDPSDPASPIDRLSLGALAFVDPAARRKLNGATHLPITVALLCRLIAAWAACRLVVVVDMPLLFETGAWRATRPRVLVDAPEEVRAARLRARDGLSPAAAGDRIAAQAPAAGKAGRCAFVIRNEGDLDEVRATAASVGVAVRRGAWVHALVTPPGLAGLVGAGVLAARRWWM